MTAPSLPALILVWLAGPQLDGLNSLKFGAAISGANIFKRERGENLGLFTQCLPAIKNVLADIS